MHHIYEYPFSAEVPAGQNKLQRALHNA